MADKDTKQVAHYVDKTRKPAQYCEDCSMFRHPHTCTKVEGYIEPGGWCKLFWKKR